MWEYFWAIVCMKPDFSLSTFWMISGRLDICLSISILFFEASLLFLTAISRAIISSIIICERAAFVLITHISGPEPCSIVRSTRRAMDDHITLTMAAVFAPLFFAYFSAFKVSYVSPDCD